MDYSILKPLPGFVIIKEEKEEEGKKFMIKVGYEEPKAYGRIICLPEITKNQLQVGQLICYNEYEGQELFKFGPVTE